MELSNDGDTDANANLVVDTCDSLEILACSTKKYDKEWIVDFGFSYHICPFKEWFINFKETMVVICFLEIILSANL